MSSEIPIELQKLKQNQRNALRQEYWKKITQPPSSSSIPGEVLFDSGHQRYFTMTATRPKFFKPTYWHGFLLTAFFIVPFALTTYVIKTDRDKTEHLIRTGQIPYQDRVRKFT